MLSLRSTLSPLTKSLRRDKMLRRLSMTDDLQLLRTKRARCLPTATFGSAALSMTFYYMTFWFFQLST
ncbi:hypothetical protein SAMN04515668_0716 [Hymenobacter arizonensis]|uniref:Uncharacterized protein n=1 Tax=Hymenobacter arizonensis TaxID=1227077 RepID=A0A1I5U1A1_HYMAR|nr:hypothetical protein SAMN04515668_0716 [Hymenobacter arizonensis]